MTAAEKEKAYQYIVFKTNKPISDGDSSANFILDNLSDFSDFPAIEAFLQSKKDEAKQLRINELKAELVTLGVTIP